MSDSSARHPPGVTFIWAAAGAFAVVLGLAAAFLLARPGSARDSTIVPPVSATPPAVANEDAPVVAVAPVTAPTLTPTEAEDVQPPPTPTPQHVSHAAYAISELVDTTALLTSYPMAVEAEVVSQETLLGEPYDEFDSPHELTFHALRVDRWIAGGGAHKDGETITFHQSGGFLPGGGVVYLEGYPILEVGQRYVIFIKGPSKRTQAGKTGYYTSTAVGVFRVEKGKLVSNGGKLWRDIRVTAELEGLTANAAAIAIAEAARHATPD